MTTPSRRNDQNTARSNFRRKPAGAAPRFGSAHVRLSGQTLRRTTFCYPDSVFEPVEFGVAARMFVIDSARADDKDALGDYIGKVYGGDVRGKLARLPRFAVIVAERDECAGFLVASAFAIDRVGDEEQPS